MSLSRAGKAPAKRPRLLLDSSPAVKASLLLQSLSLPFLLVPGAWPWILAWLLFHHTVLSIAGTVPRSTLLGPNQTRLREDLGQASAKSGSSSPSVALTFDDGPDPNVTPLVLDVLRQRSVKATFFLIGERALAHPDLVQRMIEEGHQVENHTHHHSSWFCTYLPGKLSREIVQAQRAIESAGAPSPLRFRAPAGVRSPWLQPILAHHRLHLTSWTRRGFDTSQPDPDKVLQRLTQGLGSGEILLLHDGNAGISLNGRPMVLEVLVPLLNAIDERGLAIRQLSIAP